MRYGVIDIGSNTIRGVAYQTEMNKAKKIEDKLVRSHIIEETFENRLSENGINRLVVVLNKLEHVLKKSGCTSINCFATSALRGLKNIEEIERLVHETTGIEIEVLDGTEEAVYDFIALRANVPENNAIGIDLGGGSCQIIQFDNKQMLFSESYNIGSNRMMKKYVSGNLPTLQERKKIAFVVRNELAELTNMFGSRYFYAMGGTAKAALRLYSRLSNTISEDGFLSIDKLDKMCSIIDSNPEKMYGIFTQIVKNRADTIIPGIVVLRTICDLLETDGIYVLQCSVRDGYFLKKAKFIE